MANQVSTLKMEQRFKKTPAGTIPMDWDCRTLGEVTEIQGGGTPDRKVKEYWGGPIPWATPTDATAVTGTEISQTKETISEEGLKNSAAKLMPAGSVLMSSRATLGHALINTVPMATNQGFANFICTDEIFNHFLLYLLHSKSNELSRIAAGSTFLEIPKTSLNKLSVQIPPIREQEQIADILSAVDAAIDKTTVVIEKNTELKKGLAIKAFSSKLSHQKRPQSCVGDCAQINTNALNSATDPKKIIRYIDIAAIEKTGVISSPKEIVFGEAPSRARRIVKLGDILVSTVRPYLRAFAKVDSPDSDLIASTGFCVLTPNKNVVPDYLYQFVLSDIFVKFLEGRMTGSNYPAVNPSDIAECPISLPSRSEQEKTGHALSAVDFSMRREEAVLARLKSAKQGLMTALITGRRRIGQWHKGE